jgi:hypothetical protein
MVKKFKQFLNESKEQKPYNVKFKKQIDEINALIEKAKEDDVYAIEPDST